MLNTFSDSPHHQLNRLDSIGLTHILAATDHDQEEDEEEEQQRQQQQAARATIERLNGNSTVDDDDEKDDDGITRLRIARKLVQTRYVSRASSSPAAASASPSKASSLSASSPSSHSPSLTSSPSPLLPQALPDSPPLTAASPIHITPYKRSSSSLATPLSSDSLSVASPSALSASGLPCVHFKLILLGDSNVGKTSLVHRFIDSDLTQRYGPTIGIDLLTARMLVNRTHVCTLTIVDTAGQERFHSLASSYYRGCDAVLICFDLTNQQSFLSLTTWLDEFHAHHHPSSSSSAAASKTQHAQQKHAEEGHTEREGVEESGDDECVMMVIGNKCDAVNSREVNAHSAKHWCSKRRLAYVEASALSSENVQHAFYTLVKRLFLRYITHAPHHS